jgi:uncharacterized protein
LYHPLYIEFIYHFNIDRDYYECHEVMEEYWLSQGKNKLLQALLQAAVGLYHFRNRNVNGAIKLMQGALDKCEGTWSGELGINKDKLFSEVRDYVTKLEQFENRPFTFYDLNIEIVDPELAALVKECQPEGVPEENKF